MNFSDYEADGHSLYGELARLIRDLLEDAVAKLEAVPRPQSLQHRRKTPQSLRDKLIGRKMLDCTAIEAEIKDLAGARLIFYGQDDVDAFVQARVIPKSLAVQWEETKIHYPIMENDKQRYTAIHYVVSLPEEMLAKAEYAKFAGLRCEIQIQTLLDHAYAETYHDMVYKAKTSTGFGTVQREELDRRMQRIMDTHLRPAGYELDKVRRDHRRLMRGKVLFDRHILEALEQAKDNNERRDLLDALGTDVVPHYDDIADVYADIRRSAIAAVRSARDTAQVPRQSDFGAFDSMTAADVAEGALNLLDDLRYVDVAGSFDTLIDIYRDERDDTVRKRVLEVVQHLAENNMDAWHQVGPGVQAYLADRLEQVGDLDLDPLRPLILTVARALLSPDIEGLTSKSNAIVLHKGAVQASDALKEMRRKALGCVIRVLDGATSEAQRAEAASALDAATIMPQGKYSPDLATVVLDNTVTVTNALRERIGKFQYGTLQSIEQHVLYSYERAGELGKAAHLKCQPQAKAAIASARAFRDALNADSAFVRFKMLIGHDTVVAPQWDDADFDYEQIDAYRQAEIAKYLDAIMPDSFGEWRPILNQCAAAQTDGGSELFGRLVRDLARTKPDLALQLLEDPPMQRYLPGILNGLHDAGRADTYRAVFDGHLNKGEQLMSLAIHLQALDVPRLADAEDILLKAIAANDARAIGQCIVIAFQWHAADETFCVERLLMPAVRFGLATGNPDLLYYGWFLREAKDLLPRLSDTNVALVLESHLPLARIDHRHERMLGLLAERHAARVWEFFRKRLETKGEAPRYQAVPFQLHALSAPLGKDSDLAVITVRSWFMLEDRRFRHSGGRLLHAVFHSLTPAFAASLQKLVATGVSDDIAFVIHVLHNYSGDGNAIPLIKEVVRALPVDDPLLNEVYACLGSSGVVAGEFGLVESRRRKKMEIEGWQDDADLKIQAFARGYARDLEQEIAAEQRRVEQSIAMRKLDYGEDIIGQLDNPA